MDYGKYKNALEKAKVRYNEIKGTNCNEEKFLLDLFPELKESEDEKVRKALIDLFTATSKKDWRDIPTEKIIAWLEKQKAMDKEIIFRPLAGTDIIAAAKQALEKIEIGKEVILAFNGAYIPVNGKTVAEICNEYFAWHEKQGEEKSKDETKNAEETSDEKVRKELYDFIYVTTFRPKDLKKKEIFLDWLDKQGEKKSADKVEPKFYKDDWIVNNITKDVFLIKGINNGYCTLEDIKGNIISPCLPFESEFHLWTIQDAKDGDVLVASDDSVFIYAVSTDRHAKFYVALTKYGKFNIKGGNWEDKNRVHPATKEQREILMKAMTDAGYEWDVEKKAIIPISKSKVVEYVYILDYSTGRVIVTKHDVEEPFSELFEQLGLKENQCHYMTSNTILSIEYINF